MRSDFFPRVHALRLFRFGAMGLAAIAFVLSTFGRGVEIDQGIFLLGAQQWILGHKLYLDILDVHPPQIYFLHSVPVLVSMATGWTAIFSFNLMVSLLAALSGVLFGFCVPAGYRLIGGSLWTAALLLSAHDYFFGQREYFFILAWVPYLLSRCGAENPPRWAKVAAGISLGFFICLKPHFALIAGGVEALLWLRWRRQCRALPFISFVVTGALQVAIFFAFFNFSAYRNDFRRFDYYDAVGIHYVATLLAVLRAKPFALSVLTMILATGPAAFKRPLRPFIEASAASMLLGFLLAVLQGSYRPYYLIPIYFPAIAMLIVALCQPRLEIKFRSSLSFAFAFEAWTLLAAICLFLFAYQADTGIVRLAAKRYLQGQQFQVFGGLAPDPFADWVRGHVPASDVVSIIAPQYGMGLSDPILSMLHMGRPVISRSGGLELPFSFAEATGNRQAGCSALYDIRRDIVESGSQWVFVRQQMPSWASATGDDPITHFQRYPSFWRWFTGRFRQSDQFGKYTVYRRERSFSRGDDAAAPPCP